GDARELYGRAAYPYGYALTVFAAGPTSVRQGDVISEHHYSPQRFRTISDQIRALERRGDLAVLDQIALGEGKYEIAVRDVDLTTPEGLRKNSVFYARHDLFRIMRARQQHRVGHPRHRHGGKALAAPVAGRARLEMPGGVLVVHVAA